MSSNSSVAEIIEMMPAGLVKRASDHVEKPSFMGTGVPVLDQTLRGGWTQGRLNILRAAGLASAGRTTVVTATVASVTAPGYLAAWIDGDGSMDPFTLGQSGADLKKVLWVRGPMSTDRTMKTADLIISSGIFSLIVIRPAGDGSAAGNGMQWMRLSRAAALSGATVLILERGGIAIPDAATISKFGPMQAAWTGKWGYGLLEGASIKVDPVASTDASPDCMFSSKTLWQGFPV